MSDVQYISHPLIKPDTVEQRLYQLSLAGEALKRSTLVVLPTGLGKTIVALLVMVSRLPRGKVLVLSPTKPLVEQHVAFFKSTLTILPETIVLFTGSTPPQKRTSMWESAQVVVSTPQVIENDLLGKKITLEDVSCIIFDEAHRATGDYSYVYIAEKYAQQNKEPLVLGITASPGSRQDKIQEVCAALHISAVEMRTDSDPDVRPYIFDKDIEWRYVSVPIEIKGLKQLMDSILTDRLNKLRELGFISPYQTKLSKREMLDLQARIQSQLRSSSPDQKVYKGISILAEILKLSHAIEISDTQGASALSKYFERLESEARSQNGSKAAKRLMEDLNMRRAVHHLAGCNGDNPKLNAVKELVGKQVLESPQSRIIVFTNYRDTAELVTEALKEVDGVKPVRFVGQANKSGDTGLTQKQQVDIIQKFKDGEYNTLVATSVAEEGLDIPATDLVVFFEPIPSEIRSIQRKGRTGRKHEGRVVILMAKGSKDEAYHWSSSRKEKTMLRTMQNINGELELQSRTKEAGEAGESSQQTEDDGQKKLLDFPDKKMQVPESEIISPKVYVDQREIRSPVARALEKLGMEVVLRTLEVGDYVASDRTGIERKTVEDFLSTLMDGRDLFGQISDLARTFERPLLIIEGEGLYTTRQIHPNAIRGVLSSIAIDFGVPIIFSKDEEDTAALISVIAKREQMDTKTGINLHGKKTAPTLKEQQEYVISSIPEIGPVVAKNLLQHFGSVEKVMLASREELMKVGLVGPKTADRIKEVVSGEYKG
jgi:ERCC4-related helicase